jgi:alpha-beta hydrolase superfamily lysophospholipase
MQQHHYFQEPIDAHGTGTLAYWALNAAGTAVIFVHGFNGSALRTWLNFPSMLMADPRAAGLDVVFFGYDGLFTQAGSSALQFFTFMQALMTSPHAVFPNFVKRPHAFTYSRVVIVAHSLGAVVVRRAVVDAVRAKETWPAHVRLVLFAPAHRGAYAAALASHVLTGQLWLIGKLAGSLLQYRIPLLSDLQADSPVIKQLAQDTRKQLKKGSQQNGLIAHAVVWAHDERVVINLPFLDDPGPEKLPTNHANVCKPSDNFLQPLDLVLAAVR